MKLNNTQQTTTHYMTSRHADVKRPIVFVRALSVLHLIAQRKPSNPFVHKLVGPYKRLPTTMHV